MTTYLLSLKVILHFLQFDRWRRWHPTPVLLPGKSHEWRSLVGCSPWVAKSQTWLSDFTLTFHFHTLEKEMATHSSVLAWRIPGTGEPDGLPSTGSHRVGHDWSDLAAAAEFDTHGIIHYVVFFFLSHSFNLHNFEFIHIATPISGSFHFFVGSLSGFGIRVMVAS